METVGNTADTAHCAADVAEDNVMLFPKWKKSATAAERLDELSVLASKFPERFEEVLVFYTEHDAETNRTRVRWVGAGNERMALIGIATAGIQQMLTED